MPPSGIVRRPANSLFPFPMSSSFDQRRILRNTLLLYGRMLLTVWLNLWATRLTLQHLGVDNLGVYGVVGSLVSMAGVFTNGITTTVQRFVAFELGRGASGSVSRVFSTSLSILLVSAVVLMAVLEVIGLWMFDAQAAWLNIPAESIGTARWLFQFAMLALVVDVIAIPYQALVVAHERMGAFAAISVVQVALTCLAAWMLRFLDGDRLLCYGAMMAIVSLGIRCAYHVYCRCQFPEARFSWRINRDEVREMARFAGVSTLAGVMQLLSGEGVVLLINLTFGVALNAVYAIALQLKNMVLSFALNVFKAIQPQITKTYAEGDIDSHLRLVTGGAKVEVYLVYLVLLPLLCRTQQLMSLWLGEVPLHAVAFVRGALILSLSYAAFEPIRTAVLATGRIARFVLIPEFFYLLVLPVGYLVARMTSNPVLLLATVVAMDVLACVLRVWLGTRVSPLGIGLLLRESILPCVTVGLLGGVASAWLSTLFPSTLPGLVAYLAASCLALALIVGVVQYRSVSVLLAHWRRR